MSRYAEALLPDTGALQCQTVEWTIYHRKHLVRYRDRSGQTWRKYTADPQEAEQFYLESVRKLQKEAHPQ